MKRRIKKFFRVYFFYTQQEQRGIRSLLYLLSFLFMASLVFSRFEPTPALDLDLTYLEALKDSFPANLPNKWEKPGYHKNKQWERKPIKKSPFLFPKTYVPKKLIAIDANIADSAAWVALPGIGPSLASRIIAFRTGLGGFVSLDQLTEVYGFKEDLLFDLKDKLTLSQAENLQLDLNEVDFKRLSSHPYFKYTLSKAILNYRKQHGKFENLEELRKIKIINDSIYDRIALYLKISGLNTKQ